MEGMNWISAYTTRPGAAAADAADGFTTLGTMLGGKYTTAEIKEWYASNATYPPYMQVSLGVARNMKTEPKLKYLRLKESVIVAEKDLDYLIIENYSRDPEMAPEGKTSLVIRFFTEYDYWQQLYADKKRYRAEKDAVSKSVIAVLSSLYPGIENDIEVVDVATPATYVRYTGTWRGATMSWLPTTANFARSIKKTLPGLSGFYMAGQWLVPGGGVPNAFKTGRDVIQLICKKDRKAFQH
jgi:hypothetical protein